jgi:hypothetical protein
MRVETRRSHGQVMIEVAHDGLRPPGAALEDLDGVFGTGPDRRNGLEIAQRIVAELGGELRIRSEGEWSAISVLSLPILGNEDRRRASDRRGACRDRREVGPAHRPRG